MPEANSDKALIAAMKVCGASHDMGSRMVLSAGLLIAQARKLDALRNEWGTVQCATQTVCPGNYSHAWQETVGSQASRISYGFSMEEAGRRIDSIAYVLREKANSIQAELTPLIRPADSAGAHEALSLFGHLDKARDRIETHLAKPLSVAIGKLDEQLDDPMAWKHSAADARDVKHTLPEQLALTKALDTHIKGLEKELDMEAKQAFASGIADQPGSAPSGRRR